MQAYAMHNDFSIRHFNRNPHTPETIDRRQAIFAHQKACDMGRTLRQGTKHDRTMRDRFVPRYGNCAAQRFCLR